jgi:hypothetical protein
MVQFIISSQQSKPLSFYQMMTGQKRKREQMSTKTTRREFLKQAAAGAAAAVATTVVPVSGDESTPIKAKTNEGVSEIRATITRRVCKICGKSKDEDLLLDLVALINPFVPEKAELVWVCRHGHFNATIIDAFTGMPVTMTGPDNRPPTLVVFHEDWRRKNQL